MEGSPLRPRDWSRQPPQVFPEYKSTPLRSITKPLVPLRQTLSELSGPVYGHDNLGALDADLTRNAVGSGPPIGERLIVTGRVLDEDGRPVRGTLVEVWQTNAAGRYVHVADQHDAPLVRHHAMQKPGGAALPSTCPPTPLQATERARQRTDRR